MTRTTPQNAQLALLLEVAGTPKPGNVDRHHDYPDLRFEQFLAGAVGALPGLERAAAGGRVGLAFERAVAGMADQRGGNTQFGALLMLAPLVRAAAADDLSPDGAAAVVADTTVQDACDFYVAFEHVDVAVDDPPPGLEPLDVRYGADAIPEIRARELTLAGVMEMSAPVDGVAEEWTEGFPRTFRAADRLLDLDGPVPDRTSQVFLELLAEQPDTFVETRADEETAAEATRRAQAALAGEEGPADLADEFVERDVNPGTTADLTAAALFVALERGLAV